jgi:hypothetical protein
MNERIKELIGKTLDDKFSHTWDTMTHERLLQFSEKFAELILLEVQLLIADERIKYHSVETDDALVRVSISIETHFGVTE